MKRFFLSVVVSFLALTFSDSANAQSIPTLFNAEVNGQAAYAYLTDYFEIYWVQTLQPDLLEAGGEPVRPVDSPRDVPQRVLWIGNHLEEARRMIVGVWQYRHPVGALNHKLPVVIDRLPHGLYGFASIRPNGTPYLVLNPFPEDQLLKSTIAHEYFHDVQFGYDQTTHLLYENLKTDEPFRIPTKMAEGTALWVMNRVFPDTAVYRDFFDQSAFVHPHLSIFGSVVHTEDASAQTTYGTFLWYHFLSKKFGDQIVKDLWEEQFQLSQIKDADNVPFSVRELQAHENVFAKKYQTDLKTVFEEFMVWNAFPVKYREATATPPLTMVVDSDVLPVNESARTGDFPEPFGSNYLKFATNDMDGETLRFSFQGAPQGDYSVVMMPFQSDEFIETKMVKQRVVSGEAVTVDMVPGNYDFILVGIGVTGIADEQMKLEDPFTGNRYEYHFNFEVVKPILVGKKRTVNQKSGLNTGETSVRPVGTVFEKMQLRELARARLKAKLLARVEFIAKLKMKLRERVMRQMMR